MYQSLFFLVTALLIVNVAPAAEAPLIPSDPLTAFVLSILVYATVLYLIPRVTETKANALLVLFLLGHHFVWVGHRLYLPLLHYSAALFSIVSLGLYFAGLAVYHRRKGSATGIIGKPVQFLFPFVLPFIGFQLLFDLLGSLPSDGLQDLLRGSSDPLISAAIWLGITAFFWGAVIILLPVLVVRLWGCEPLPATPLHAELELLCQRLKFRHAGLRVWTILSSATTAAIIGIMPRFRYVIFTPRLLNDLPPAQIEAVLAHEIGHTYHRHLLLYPLILLGMIAVSGVISYFVIEPLLWWSALHYLLSPSDPWKASTAFIILVPLLVMALAYIRLVFGLFSRNFERQADLHIFRAGISPDVMIEALDSVARANQMDPKEKNWHHYGINERSDFLHQAAANPALITGHNRRVRRLVAGYFALLSLAILWLAATEINWQPVSEPSQSLKDHITSRITAPTRQALAEHYALSPLATQFLTASYLFQDGEVPGVAEYYTARQLAMIDHWEESAQLMIAAWQRFDFSVSTPTARADFIELSQHLLSNIPADSQAAPLADQLRRLSQ